MINYWLRRMFRRMFRRTVHRTLDCPVCKVPVVEVFARSWFVEPMLAVYQNATILCDDCRGKRIARQILDLIALRDRVAGNGHKDPE